MAAWISCVCLTARPACHMSPSCCSGWTWWQGKLPFAQELVPGFRRVMMQYHSACLACTLRINKLIAIALDLPASFFDADFTRPIVSLRPLHYAPSISAPEKVSKCSAALAAEAHAKAALHDHACTSLGCKHAMFSCNMVGLSIMQVMHKCASTQTAEADTTRYATEEVIS